MTAKQFEPIWPGTPELLTPSSRHRVISNRQFRVREAEPGDHAAPSIAGLTGVGPANRLRRSNESVAAIAYSVSYESETAFRTAFRRRMARTPMQYRRIMDALLLHRTLR